MTLLDYSFDLFKGIREKKYSFAYAVNKKIQEMSLSSLETNTIKACLKAVVNRYYFLKYEIKKAYGNVDGDELDFLVLALSYCRYVSKVTVEDVLNFLKESENEQVQNIDLTRAHSCLESLKNNVTQIEPNIEKNIVKKLSLTYSYPEWLVGMMKKHFGGKNTYKSVASSRRNTPINITINPSSSLVEINDDSNFKKIPFASNSYEYIGKEPLIENAYFKEKKIYVMDAMEQFLVDKLAVFQGDEVLVIGENKSTLVGTIALSMYGLGNVYYSCGNQESYFASRKVLDLYRIKNVIPFEGEVNLVCTHVKENSMDKVLVIPPNSEFGLIRRKPEILIHFNQNDLDSLIENQSKYLIEAASFVKEGGTLVYAVPTLNIKESFNIVRKFIEEHDEFVLDNEELIFPYVYQSTGMYYAKLIKKSNDLEEVND